jgi:hypothetical protein
MPGSGDRQFRAGIEQTLGPQGHHQVAFPAVPGGEDRLPAQLAEGAQDRLDVAVGKGSRGGEELLRRDPGFVAPESSQGFDLLRRPMGQIGQGALARLVAFAPPLAQEDGGGRVRESWRRDRLRWGTVSIYMGCIMHK